MPEYLVACKTALDRGSSTAARDDLLQEATVMARVGSHPNVVSLIGVVTRGDPWIIVVSLCEHGSLLSALIEHADDGAPYDTETKLKMCHQITCGMAHLASCRIVHRDLAARNVLVASGTVCKVADFGLSRSAAGGSSGYYYISSNFQFPVKWTAPEAMISGRFALTSDVWSFGITVVEVFQDGLTPYTGVSNPAIITLVKDGGCHAQPPNCPATVYDILLDCWQPDPDNRPHFDELAGLFVDLESIAATDVAGSAAERAPIAIAAAAAEQGPAYVYRDGEVSARDLARASFAPFPRLPEIPPQHVAPYSTPDAHHDVTNQGYSTPNDHHMIRALRRGSAVRRSEQEEDFMMGPPGTSITAKDNDARTAAYQNNYGQRQSVVDVAINLGAIPEVRSSQEFGAGSVGTCTSILFPEGPIAVDTLERVPRVQGRSGRGVQGKVAPGRISNLAASNNYGTSAQFEKAPQSQLLAATNDYGARVSRVPPHPHQKQHLPAPQPDPAATAPFPSTADDQAPPNYEELVETKASARSVSSVDEAFGKVREILPATAASSNIVDANLTPQQSQYDQFGARRQPGTYAGSADYDQFGDAQQPGAHEGSIARYDSMLPDELLPPLSESLQQERALSRVISAGQIEPVYVSTRNRGDHEPQHPAAASYGMIAVGGEEYNIRQAANNSTCIGGEPAAPGDSARSAAANATANATAAATNNAATTTNASSVARGQTSDPPRIRAVPRGSFSAQPNPVYVAVSAPGKVHEQQTAASTHGMVAVGGAEYMITQPAGSIGAKNGALLLNRAEPGSAAQPVDKGAYRREHGAVVVETNSAAAAYSRFALPPQCQQVVTNTYGQSSPPSQELHHHSRGATYDVLQPGHDLVPTQHGQPSPAAAYSQFGLPQMESAEASTSASTSANAYAKFEAPQPSAQGPQPAHHNNAAGAHIHFNPDHSRPANTLSMRRVPRMSSTAQDIPVYATGTTDAHSPQAAIMAVGSQTYNIPQPASRAATGAATWHDEAYARPPDADPRAESMRYNVPRHSAPNVSSPPLVALCHHARHPRLATRPRHGVEPLAVSHGMLDGTVHGTIRLLRLSCFSILRGSKHVCC